MSVGHAGHDHTHGMAKRQLRLAFLLTTIIFLASLLGGLFANSLALLFDAVHMITDLFALGLAWFAASQAERPSNERKTFGYHRVGILAAWVNALTLLVIVLVIGWEAIQRLQHPEPVVPVIMFGAAAIAILVNLYISFGLRKEEGNLNVRAASLHVLSDIGASFGVIVAGLIILLTGWNIVDPLLSMGIAVLVAFGAWHILRETMDILLEAVPKDIPMEQLVKDMRAISGVKDVHDLHVWCITNSMYALSCHVMIDNLPPSDSSPILQSLTDLLNIKYHIGHSTIQFETQGHEGTCICEKDDLYCQMKVAHEHEHGHSHA